MLGYVCTSIRASLVGYVFRYNVIMSWTDSTGGDDHVVIGAHPSYGLDYLALIIRNDFNSL